MSHNEHAAGGIEGLSLGAPIGGVSTTPAHGLGSSTSTTTTSHGATSGLTSGLTSGSHGTHDHLDRTGDAHRTSTGAAAANVTNSAYNTDARNTTSGERGIGGGHGGPTAFESNPERVGTDRKHDGPRDHSLGGLTGGTVADVERQGPNVVRTGDHDFHGKEVRGSTFGEVDNTKTHGHGDHTHDRDHDRHGSNVPVVGTHDNHGARTGSNVPVVGTHDNHGARTGSNVPVVGTHDNHGARTGSNVPVVGTHDNHGARTGSNVPVVGTGASHEHHSHSSGTGLAAGGLAAGGLAAGAGGAALVGSGAKPSPFEGVVGDSVTGQQHFKGNSTGLATGAHTGAHSGVGAAPVAAVTTGAAATGISPATLSHSNNNTTTGEKSHHKETGLVAELKQELKDHQKSGGYSDADKHPESDGPHGLVWHNGKYVHKRELDNHGSTGVPLK